MTEVETDSFIEELKSYGRLPDEDIDLASVALTLAACDHPGISYNRYHTHLDKLAESVAALCKEENDTLAARLAALKTVLVKENDYTGDSDTYDDLQNADLMRVIDRRRGMPISLSILYIHVARSLGWEAHGLNIPGHFVVRLDQDGDRLIFDPFNDCTVLEAADLRRLVKKSLGPQAELSAEYYVPASNRAILMRLQNNIKTRLIEMEDYEAALRIVEAMRLLDPNEYRLLLDAGVLYARTDQIGEAIEILETYIAKAPNEEDRHEAALLLRQLQHVTA